MFKNEEGFSLLELVVAVGVAGIIAAVALPTFAGLQDKATTTSATYAASASAAEVLANSTMGLTGSTGSSSSSATINSTTLNAGHFGSGSSHYVNGGIVQMMSDINRTTYPSTSYDGTADAANALASLKVGDQIVYSGNFTGTFTVTSISTPWSSGNGAVMYQIGINDANAQWWGTNPGTSSADTGVTVTFIYN